MAYPTVYNLTYSYTGFEVGLGDASFPGTQLDADMAGLHDSIENVSTFVEAAFTADGGLKPGIVTADALAANVGTGVATAALLAARDQAVAAAATAVSLSGAPASAITFTPGGTISSTNVQAAIAELGTEKSANGHTHTALEITLSAVTGLVASSIQAAIAELRAMGPQTGDVVLQLDDTAPTGWLMMDDGTIGDALSGASTLASSTAETLFTLLWNKVSNTYAPVTPSGRGASAAADWAAHKKIGLLAVLGRVLGVAGVGSGLTTRAVGQTVGEETHLLTTNELASHSHGITEPNAGQGHLHNMAGLTISQGAGTTALPAGNTPTTGSYTTAYATTGITVNANGSNQPHNVMQPTTFLKARIRL